MPDTTARGAHVSTSVGDYLKAIWMLGRTGSVSTKELAEELTIAPASVSEMLRRLDEMGLVRHVPYHGVTLAPGGLKEALRLVRRHRLIETFLVKHLGYTWDEVHAEAEVLEHAVSDRFIRALDDLLGNPTHDPHGDPIPTAEGTLPETPDVPLTTAPAGARFRVSRLRTQDSEELAHLSSLGLLPGRLIEVEGLTDAGGEIVVRSDGERVHLERRLAALVHGEVL